MSRCQLHRCPAIALALVLALASCGRPGQTQPQRWAAAWVEAMNSKSLSHFDPILHGSYEDPLTNGPLIGPPLAMYLVELWQAYPQAAYRLQRTVGNARTLVIEWVATGMGPSTPQHPLSGVFVLDLSADAIIRVRAYFDARGLLLKRG